MFRKHIFLAIVSEL